MRTRSYAKQQLVPLDISNKPLRIHNRRYITGRFREILLVFSPEAKMDVHVYDTQADAKSPNTMFLTCHVTSAPPVCIIMAVSLEQYGVRHRPGSRSECNTGTLIWLCWVVIPCSFV